MNRHFNLTRFGRLFRKHTIEHLTGSLLAVAVLLGGLAVVLGFVAYLNSNAPFDASLQGTLFTMGLVATGIFYTSTVFAPFGDKRQATAALTLPASHLEKYLVGWLFALPFFVAVYVGCFYLIDALVISLDDWAGARPALVPLFSNDSRLYASLGLYAMLNGLFLAGSIFFTRLHFVKTAFAVMLTLVVLALLSYKLAQGIVGPEVQSAAPFSMVSFKNGMYTLELPPVQQQWLLLLPLGLALLGWAAAYARLTEKEV